MTNNRNKNQQVAKTSSGDVILNKPRPNDETAEKRVISTILVYPEAYTAVSSMICDDSFFDNDMRTIYRYIAKTAKEGDRPDLVAVGQRIQMSMQKEEAQRLIYVMATCGKDLHGTDTTVQQDMKVLEHYRQQRLYIELGERLTYSADRMLPEELSDIVLDYQQRLVSAEANVVMDKKAINDEILTIVRKNQDTPDNNGRTWTGFRIFDEEGGFLPGKLIIVAAQTSQGKSSLALTFAYNAMAQGQSVAIYSMEMDHNSIGVRMMNITGMCIKESKVLYDRLLMPQAVEEAAEKLNAMKGNYYVDDKSNTSIDKIIESIRMMKQKYGIVGAVVDYIQILNVYAKSGKNQEQILADAARRLQEEAKASKVWVLILSQISRNTEPGQTHDPSADKLRGSGQILEAADMSILLYRPIVYKEQYPGEWADVDTLNTAMLKLTKCRGGASQKVEIVHFYPEMTYFMAFGETEKLPRTGMLPQGQGQPPMPF